MSVSGTNTRITIPTRVACCVKKYFFQFSQRSGRPRSAQSLYTFLLVATVLTVAINLGCATDTSRLSFPSLAGPVAGLSAKFGKRDSVSAPKQDASNPIDNRFSFSPIRPAAFWQSTALPGPQTNEPGSIVPSPQPSSQTGANTGAMKHRPAGLPLHWQPLASAELASGREKPASQIALELEAENQKLRLELQQLMESKQHLTQQLRDSTDRIDQLERWVFKLQQQLQAEHEQRTTCQSRLDQLGKRIVDSHRQREKQIHELVAVIDQLERQLRNSRHSEGIISTAPRFDSATSPPTTGSEHRRCTTEPGSRSTIDTQVGRREMNQNTASFLLVLFSLAVLTPAGCQTQFCDCPAVEPLLIDGLRAAKFAGRHATNHHLSVGKSHANFGGSPRRATRH